MLQRGHENVASGLQDEKRISRAQWLRKAVGGAAAVVAAGIAAAVGSTKVAKAATNDPTLLGNNGDLGNPNLAEDATEVRYDGAAAPGVVLLAQADNNYTPLSASFPAALAGWTSTNADIPNGVYGYTEQPGGIGVVGWARTTNAFGVHGRSDASVGGAFVGDNRAPVNLHPVLVNVPPPTGQAGDLYVTINVDNFAILWFHTGVLGWKQVSLVP